MTNDNPNTCENCGAESPVNDLCDTCYALWDAAGCPDRPAFTAADPTRYPVGTKP